MFVSTQLYLPAKSALQILVPTKISHLKVHGKAIVLSVVGTKIARSKVLGVTVSCIQCLYIESRKKTVLPLPLNAGLVLF